MLHKWSFVLIFIFFTLLTFGQDKCNIYFSGNIFDEHDGTPLAFSSVEIMELSTGVLTDTNGFFHFKNLCPGIYNLKIIHLDCDTLITLVNLEDSKVKNFYLEHHTEELQEIIIAYEKALEKPSQNTQILEQKDIELNNEKDLGSILNRLEGVSILQTGSNTSKPIIDGLHSNRILIIQNNVRFVGQDWGTEHAPEIDPSEGNEILVIRGAGTVQYGVDAMGGVILLNPAPLPKQPGIRLKAQLVSATNGGLVGTGLTVEGSLKKITNLGWRIKGSFRKSGDQHAPDYNLSNTGYQQGNTSIALGYNKFKWGLQGYYSLFSKTNGILKAAHIGNLTDLQNAIGADTPLIVLPFTYAIEAPKQSTIHHIIKSNAYFRVNEMLKLNLQYAAQINQRQEYDIRRISSDNRPSLDLNLNQHSLDANLEHFLSDKIAGTAGISYNYTINTNIPGTGVRPLIPNYSNQNTGIYIFEKWSNKHMELDAGFRYDYTRFNAKKRDRNNNLIDSVFNFNNFSGSLGWQYAKKDHFYAKINIGFATRNPNAAELFSEGLHHGTASLEQGNTSLKPEKGLKTTYSIDFFPIKSLTLSFGGFFNYLRDYIFLEPQPELVLTIRGAFPQYFYKQTSANIYGCNGSIKYEHKNWLDILVKGEALWGKDHNTDDWLYYMPQNSLLTAINFHHDINKKIVFESAVSYTYTFRQRNFPKSFDFIDPPSGYSMLEWSIYLTQKLSKHSLQYGVVFENLTNTSYRSYTDKLRYFSDLPGFNCLFKVNYFFNNKS